MFILGIDPGIAGGVCAFHGSDNEGPSFVAGVIDIPTMPFGKTGNKREVDVVALADWIRPLPVQCAFIERVAAMPSIPDENGKRRGMGATSAFNFGGAYFAIRATLRLLGIGIVTIEAPAWKAFHGLRKTDKEASRQMALNLHPEASPWLVRKKDHGRSEAILIAHYSTEKNGRTMRMPGV